jgi:hypothetical protein
MLDGKGGKGKHFGRCTKLNLYSIKKKKLLMI